MEGNPFMLMVNRIKDEFKESLPVNMRLGKVVSETPLKIEVNGLTLDREDFLKNSNLQWFYLNETLLLIPMEEEQRYIIVAKVVDA